MSVVTPALVPFRPQMRRDPYRSRVGLAEYESRGVVGFALTRSLVAQSAGVSSTG